MDDSAVLHHQYLVVFRAGSASIVPWGRGLQVNALHLDGRSVITIRTRYVDKGLESPLPGDLWVEVKGDAESIEHAVSTMGSAAATILTVVAFATNAAIGDMEPELAFDCTPGVKERAFLQSLLPEERPILGRGRRVPDDAVYALMWAIEGYRAAHGEFERLIRAMAQYRLALNHWKWGHETMSTAHLYMGMEALTKVVLRKRLLESNSSEEELAREMGIDPMSLGPGERLSTLLDAAIRRKVLFCGDDECHRSAKKASDGFEHGFMPFEEVREHALLVRDKTAAYLRTAILDLLEKELGQEHREALLSPPFSKPIGKWPLVKYARGELVGEADALADAEMEYPLMKWRSAIKAAQMDEDGEYQLVVEETLSPRLGDGVQFRLKSFEVWQP
ncbi:MAG: hypothetical protein K1X50_10470 [Candidatus Promineofilum sp.]|nr:hypothetical protein [Promineifilum sp.]